MSLIDQAIIIVDPETIDAADFEQAYELVRSGDAVPVPGLWQRMRRAHLLGIITRGPMVVCVAAIKNPSATHVRDVMTQSGSAIPPGTRELGYVTTRLELRGQNLANELCRAVSERYEGPLFATTSSPTIKHILSSLGWNQTGARYRSEHRPEEQLTLWVRGLAQSSHSL